MLEKWLETLEEKKKGLLEEIEKLTINKSVVELAKKEIEINAQSVKNYLTQLSETKYPILEGNLREKREIYNGDDENDVEIIYYRDYTNHIQHHLGKMEKVVEQLKKNNFNPEFARHY